MSSAFDALKAGRRALSLQHRIERRLKLLALCSWFFVRRHRVATRRPPLPRRSIPPLIGYRELKGVHSTDSWLRYERNDPKPMAVTNIGHKGVMVCQMDTGDTGVRVGRGQRSQEKYTLHETLEYNWDHRAWYRRIVKRDTDPETDDPDTERPHLPYRHTRHTRRMGGRVLHQFPFRLGSDGNLCVCRVLDKVLYVGISREQSYLFEYDIPTEDWTIRNKRTTLLAEVERRRSEGEIDLPTPDELRSREGDRNRHVKEYSFMIQNRDRVVPLLSCLETLVKRLEEEGGTEDPVPDDMSHFDCECHKDEALATSARIACVRAKLSIFLDMLLRDDKGVDGYARLAPGVFEREREIAQRRREWLRVCDVHPQYQSFWPPPAHAPITCCLEGKLVLLGGYTKPKVNDTTRDNAPPLPPEDTPSSAVSLYDPETSMWTPLPDTPAHIQVGTGCNSHAVVDDTLHIFHTYQIPLTPEEREREAERARVTGENRRYGYQPRTARAEHHHITMALIYGNGGETGCKWTDEVVHGSMLRPEGDLVGLPGQKILALGSVPKEACLYDCASGEWYRIGHLFPKRSKREREERRSWLRSEREFVDMEEREPHVTLYSVSDDSVSVLVAFTPHKNDDYHAESPTYGIVTLNSELLFGDTSLTLPRWDADEARGRADTRYLEGHARATEVERRREERRERDRRRGYY
ncbi:hypothetical protein KIPB_006149 [Kipferlia bialata]|uniref:Uncharacterized protein n=1 Tax=Kipferlia bialata TaxID=797122 RepID=A0A9K3CWS9_9EUKA|nr:hypothetical protein KIPB_006149 [Kipferlia bialata]|eukprot:g6149.t1